MKYRSQKAAISSVMAIRNIIEATLAGCIETSKRKLKAKKLKYESYSIWNVKAVQKRASQLLWRLKRESWPKTENEEIISSPATKKASISAVALAKHQPERNDWRVESWLAWRRGNVERSYSSSSVRRESDLQKYWREKLWYLFYFQHVYVKNLIMKYQAEEAWQKTPWKCMAEEGIMAVAKQQKTLDEKKKAEKKRKR